MDHTHAVRFLHAYIAQGDGYQQEDERQYCSCYNQVTAGTMCARWAWANTSTKMSRNSSRSAFGRFRERAARMPARSFSYVDEDAYFFRLISTPPRPSEPSRPFDAKVRYTCTPFWFFISKRERPPATGRLDRLALLGEMTASMAHEVNQPISGIIMNAGTLRMQR